MIYHREGQAIELSRKKMLLPHTILKEFKPELPFAWYLLGPSHGLFF